MPPFDGATTLVRPSQALALKEEGASVRVIPVWASPPDLCVLAMLGGTRPEVAAALRVIRHRVERLRARETWAVGVTSARPGEGKSTFAVQLALVLSEAQRARVLLIEASMHRPSLARLLGFRVPPGLGFSVQLARRMRLHPPAEDGPCAGRSSGAEPWTVLALGPTLHAMVESDAEQAYPQALHSTYFPQAVDRLSHAYDWVVVDGPTVLGSGDANVVEEAVDGMIVVARANASRGADVRAAIRQLGDRKALGVVLWDTGGGAQR